VTGNASYVQAKFQNSSIKAPILVRPPIRVPAPGGNQEFITETTSLNGVVVLALVCKRIPKSPNPDPKHAWLA
jgi:hypothetical protein